MNFLNTDKISERRTQEHKTHTQARTSDGRPYSLPEVHLCLRRAEQEGLREESEHRARALVEPDVEIRRMR